MLNDAIRKDWNVNIQAALYAARDPLASYMQRVLLEVFGVETRLAGGDDWICLFAKEPLSEHNYTFLEGFCMGLAYEQMQARQDGGTARYLIGVSRTDEEALRVLLGDEASIISAPTPLIGGGDLYLIEVTDRAADWQAGILRFHASGGGRVFADHEAAEIMFNMARK